jgi:hypothetical protein
MSDDRHQHLIKCAEQAIGLMNIGIDPNAALLKVARDGELTSNEVLRVSHAINNSKTLSVLANSDANEKDKAFPITNAEVVNQRLYDADPASDAAAKKDEKDAEKNEKTDAMEPKLAAALDMPVTNAPKLKRRRKAALESNHDKGSYLAGNKEDHAAAFQNALGGPDPLTHKTTKVAVTVGDHHQVKVDISGEGRTTGNPFHQLTAIKHAADEASLAYTKAYDIALDGLFKLADEFRRTDSPRFDRIEKLAILSGVSDETIAMLFEAGSLDRLGHKRASGEKLAGLNDVSPREQSLVDAMHSVEAAYLIAGEKLAARDLLRAGLENADEYLKTAVTIGLGLGSAAEGVKALSGDIANLPDKMTGAGMDPNDQIDLYGGAAGSVADPSKDKPEPLTEETALPVSIRQQISNADSRGNIEELLADPYIREHPIQDVVSAYNKVKGVNPNLSTAELSSLMRQSLASEGSLPFDTLARARGKKDV